LGLALDAVTAGTAAEALVATADLRPVAPGSAEDLPAREPEAEPTGKS
jgi:hypothetical protein